MKRLVMFLGGGVAMLVMGLTLVGGSVFAQTGSDGGTQRSEVREAYLTAVAAELGVSMEELEAAMTAGELAVIDQMSENARERVLNGGGLFRGDGRMGDRSHDRIHDRLDRGANLRDGTGFAELAVFLGISESELRAELRDGSTLLEIASANGKSDEALRTFLVQQATDRIDQQLQDSSTDSSVPATPVA